jgi:hypothetical protein
MDPDSYAKDLSSLADAYEASEITPGEWRERMADLRDKRQQAQERQP